MTIKLAFRCGSVIIPNVQSNRKVTNRFTRKARQWYPQNTYLSSYTVCNASTLNTIGLYNKTGAQYRLSKQRIAFTNPLKMGYYMHALTMCIRPLLSVGAGGGGGVAAGDEAILGYADRTTYYLISVNLCFPVQVER